MTEMSDNARVSREECEAILKRAEAATEWTSDQCHIRVDHDGYIYAAECATLGDTLIQQGGHYEGYGEDWMFVAHARVDVPKLARAHIALLDSSEQTITEAWKQARETGEEINLHPLPETSLDAMICAIGDKYSEQIDELRSQLAQAQKLREALRLGDADGIRAAIWAFDAARSAPETASNAQGEAKTK